MPVDVGRIESVLAAYRQLMQALHTDLASGAEPWYECSLTLPQLRALSLIATSQLGLSSRELATSLGVGPSAITPLVDRLVERGFAQRTEDPHDRRIARLRATQAGLATLERLHADRGEVVRKALSQLEPDELQSVGVALQVLQTGLRRASSAARADVQLPQGSTA